MPLMSSPPIVSVLIPAWNRERHIEAAVRSALDQTMPDLEVIVSDNASTDRTCEIVERLAAEDPRVRLIRQGQNIGPVPNWRACASVARGKYAKILWSDDVDHPEFLERGIAALEACSASRLYLANVSLIDAEGRMSCDRLYRFHGGCRSIPSSTMLRWLLTTHRMPVSPGCALMPMDILRQGLAIEIPAFRPGSADWHGVGPDVMTLLWASLQGERVVLDGRPLARFRAHSGSITMASRKRELEILYLIAKSAFLDAFGDRLPSWIASAGYGVNRVMLTRLRAAEYLGVDDVSKISRCPYGAARYAMACIHGAAICGRERVRHDLLSLIGRGARP